MTSNVWGLALESGVTSGRSDCGPTASDKNAGGEIFAPANKSFVDPVVSQSMFDAVSTVADDSTTDGSDGAATVVPTAC
jgi:hypothetical protein